MQQEEFHSAADLLRKALWDKSSANKKEATSPKFVENALREEGTESASLQNPDTSKRNGDLQVEKCKVVAKDKDSNSLSCNSANISCNFESKQEQDKDGSKHSTEHTNVLTPEENSSTGLSYEVSSFSKSPALAELHFSDIDVATTSILREHDSESEDELEQFLFQPKSRREGNCNFSST